MSTFFNKTHYSLFAVWSLICDQIWHESHDQELRSERDGRNVTDGKWRTEFKQFALELSDATNLSRLIISFLKTLKRLIYRQKRRFWQFENYIFQPPWVKWNEQSAWPWCSECKRTNVWQRMIFIKAASDNKNQLSDSDINYTLTNCLQSRSSWFYNWLFLGIHKNLNLIKVTTIVPLVLCKVYMKLLKSNNRVLGIKVLGLRHARPGQVIHFRDMCAILIIFIALLT